MDGNGFNQAFKETSLTHIIMINPNILFGSIMLLVACIIAIFNYKFGALKDSCSGAVKNKPYSFGRVQLSWWTMIVFSSFAACIFVTKQLPNLDPTILGLLGIAGGTTLLSTVIDSGKKQETSIEESRGFFPDILNNGDMHRLQLLLFNTVIGMWLILQVAHNLSTPLTDKFTVDNVIPSIPQYILVLIGGSSALYLGCKTQE